MPVLIHYTLKYKVSGDFFANLESWFIGEKNEIKQFISSLMAYRL